MSPRSDNEIVEQMRDKSRHLESILDDFSARLRRMRQRNREVEQEIGEFEHDLGRMKHWLEEIDNA